MRKIGAPRSPRFEEAENNGGAIGILPSGLVLPVLLLSIVHAGLCVWFHYDRAWQGDEWGSYLAASYESYRNLLTHFGDWQTMNFYLSGLKAIHDHLGGTNWLLVLPGILCGVGLVWLVAALALRLDSGRLGALVAALLVAVNPLLVPYSVTIRAYIFLATFSAAMMLFLLAWRRTGGWREGLLCGMFGALALLAHLNAIYTFVATGALVACWTLDRARRHEPGWFEAWCRLAVPVGALGTLGVAAYMPQWPDIERFRAVWFDTPPIPLTFLPFVFVSFFGSGYLLMPILSVLLYAAWRACRDRRESRWMILAVIVVVAAISLAGVSHYPWAYPRFLIAALPWLVLVIADGIGTVGGRRRIAATAIAVVLSVCSLVVLSGERQRQHARPWHRITQYVRQEMAPTDWCVVLGRQVHNAAMLAYGIQTHGNLADVLSRLPTDKPVRVILVVGPGAFTTKFPAREFGEMRVMSIAGMPQAIVTQLVEEMIASANGRVNGELADVYRQVASLLRWSGRAEEAIKYDLLQKECRFHDRRFRDQPPQFLRSESSQPSI